MVFKTWGQKAYRGPQEHKLKVRRKSFKAPRMCRDRFKCIILLRVLLRLVEWRVYPRPQLSHLWPWHTTLSVTSPPPSPPPAQQHNPTCPNSTSGRSPACARCWRMSRRPCSRPGLLPTSASSPLMRSRGEEEGRVLRLPL